MIARTWRGAVRAEDSDAYLEYLNQTGLAEYGNTPGNGACHYESSSVFVLIRRESKPEE